MIGVPSSAVSPTPGRVNSSSRSKRARKARLSSGRGSPGAGRRPSSTSICVPGVISPSATACPTSAAARSTSPDDTPARRSIETKLSPGASVTTSWICGRSGALFKGMTCAVGPMRRPESAPSASGRIIWLRNSLRTSSSCGIAGRASKGVRSGQNASASAPRPTIVPSPRNQRRLPTSSARSGARSSPSSQREAASFHSS